MNFWLNVNSSMPEASKDNLGFDIWPHVLLHAPTNDIEFVVGYYDTVDQVWREASLDEELDNIQWWMPLEAPG